MFKLKATKVVMMVVEEKRDGWLAQPFICGALFTPRFRLLSGFVVSAPALMH